MNIATTVEHILNSLKTSPLGIFNFIPRLESLLKEIIMKQDELLAKLEELQATQEQTKTALDKVMGEVSTLVTALANTNNDLSPEVSAAVEKLIATSSANLSAAQALDALNPDAVVEPAPTPAVEPIPAEDLSGASPS